MFFLVVPEEKEGGGREKKYQSALLNDGSGREGSRRDVRTEAMIPKMMVTGRLDSVVACDDDDKGEGH
jgi:hypothetical protein